MTTFPTTDPSVVICEQDYTAARAALPFTGTGSSTGSGSGMMLWALLAASLGGLSLMLMGLALRRRA